MSKVGKVSIQTLKQGVGAVDPSHRDKHDSIWGYRSLLSRGLLIVVGVEGEYKFYLSPSGQRKVQDIEAELQKIKAKKPSSGGIEKRTGPKAPKGVKKVSIAKRAKKRTKADVETVTEPKIVGV